MPLLFSIQGGNEFLVIFQKRCPQALQRQTGAPVDDVTAAAGSSLCFVEPGKRIVLLFKAAFERIQQLLPRRIRSIEALGQKLDLKFNRRRSNEAPPP